LTYEHLFIHTSAERTCTGGSLPTPAWGFPSWPATTTRTSTPAEEYPTLSEPCAAGLAAVAERTERWLAWAMDYHAQVMVASFLSLVAP
jgi:hypothetical protein